MSPHTCLRTKYPEPAVALCSLLRGSGAFLLYLSSLAIMEHLPPTTALESGPPPALLLVTVGVIQPTAPPSRACCPSNKVPLPSVLKPLFSPELLSFPFLTFLSSHYSRYIEQRHTFIKHTDYYSSPNISLNTTAIMQIFVKTRKFI